MIRVGLTGGTGSGKGYICSIFSNLGIKSIDTDEVCRIVYKKGQKCYDELVSYFGNAILDSEKEIDRKSLFNSAFSDPERYDFLCRTAYRHILLYTSDWLLKREEDGDIAAIIDAPMLFESGFSDECDFIVSVICDRETQIKRVTARDGISKDAAIMRIEKQMSNDERIKKSDAVIYNGKADEKTVSEQVNAVYEKIRMLYSKKHTEEQSDGKRGEPKENKE